MEYKLTRRRFAGLAIASSTVAGISFVASKTWAQTADIAIGIRAGSPASDNISTGIASAVADVAEQTADTPSTTRQLITSSLNLATTQVQSSTPQTIQGGAAPIIQNDEAISGFASLADGTLVVALTPVRSGRRGGSTTFLRFLGSSRADLRLSGLNRQDKIQSLLGTKDGKLLGLVVKRNGTPPVRLVEINLQTGNFSNRANLPGNLRINNLAQCPDGKFYTTSVENSGATNLVQLDLGTGQPINQVQLKFNGIIWNNGLESLVCTSGNQLLGFGALRYQSPKALYNIDASSGVMSGRREFDVAKVTVRPS